MRGRDGKFVGNDTAEDVNSRIHVIEHYLLQGVNYIKSKLKQGEDIEVVFNKEKSKYGREVANGLARIT